MDKIAQEKYRVIIPLLITLFTFFLPRSGSAFSPDQLVKFTFSPSSSSHEAITRAAILGGSPGAGIPPGVNGVISDFFRGVFGFSPNINLLGFTPLADAVQEIVKANACVDLCEDYLPENHFDAEHFAGGVKRLSDGVDSIVNNLLMVDTLDAVAVQGLRQTLGGLLHTLQDFYAHTNWIEAGNTNMPFPSLTPPTLSANITFPLDIGPCTNGDLTPLLRTKGHFTSGYFVDIKHPFDLQGAPSLPPFDPQGAFLSPQQCIHGGRLDSLAYSFDPLIPISCPSCNPVVFNSTVGINKDSFNSQFSPHSSLHDKAVGVATVATENFIRGIRDVLAMELARTGEKNPGKEADRRMLFLFGFDPLVVRSNNLTSAFTLSLTLDPGLMAPFPVLTLNPLEVLYQFMPDIGTAIGHTLVVRGITSQSVTGLSFYTLTLPSSLEFVQVVSDRGGAPVDLSGQRTHSDLLVLRPVSGPAHRFNTYTIKSSGPFLPLVLP